MSAAVARIRDFFFESQGMAKSVPAPPPVLADRVAVLGRADRVEAPAAALALRSASEMRAQCALVARWGVRGHPWRSPPTRGASRAAGLLRARGLAAVASGRLVRLDLPAANGGSELARAAAAIDGPAVLAVGVARDEEVDRVLREHDELVLVGDDERPIDRLAAESLAALGRPLSVVPPLGRTGVLALAGLRAEKLTAPPRLGEHG